MAKNVTINGVDYQNVPSVKIPLTSDPSQEAEFFDTSDATVSSADQILDGYSVRVLLRIRLILKQAGQQ